MGNQSKRVYGLDRGSFGDILYNNEDKEFFCKVELGHFSLTFYLIPRDDGNYDLEKKYKDGKEWKSFKIGRTFEVKDKDGKKVNGLTRGAIGLFSEYDKSSKKMLVDSADCFVFVTHKLKEQKKLNDKLTKVGYITGKIAIEKDSDNNNKQKDDDGDEIPF